MQANFDVLYAYLSCHNYDWHYDVTRHLLPQHYLLGQMKRDIEPFAGVQKEKNGRGFDLIIEKAKTRMARHQARPNILIIAPEMQLYCQMVPEAKVVYSEGGERAVSRFENYDGRKDTPVATIRGLDVHVSNPFEDNEVGRPNQMLRRQTQVGEFYIMCPPPVLGESPLPQSYMNLILFDERRDQLSHLTFRSALLRSMPWEVVPEVAVDDDPFKVRAGSKDPNIGASVAKMTADVFKARVDTLAEGDKECLNMRVMKKEKTDAVDLSGLNAVAIVKFLEKFEHTSKDHWRALVVLAELGVWVPIQVAVTRPFIEHHMLSAILAVAGRDTGATLFGPSDMQIAANVAVKTIEGYAPTPVPSLCRPLSPPSAAPCPFPPPLSGW